MRELSVPCRIGLTEPWVTKCIKLSRARSLSGRWPELSNTNNSNTKQLIQPGNVPTFSSIKSNVGANSVCNKVNITFNYQCTELCVCVFVCLPPTGHCALSGSALWPTGPPPPVVSWPPEGPSAPVCSCWRWTPSGSQLWRQRHQQLIKTKNINKHCATKYGSWFSPTISRTVNSDAAENKINVQDTDAPAASNKKRALLVIE